MLKDFPWVYDSEPLTKILGIFSDRKADVVVVENKANGRLVGVVTKRAMLKPNLNPSKVSARTLAVRTPRLRPSDSLHTAAKHMLERNLKALPVTEAGKPSGLVTAADVILNSRELLRKISVSKVMTREVITVDAEDTIGRAISVMRDEGVSRLPVLEGDTLAGIVTVTDIVERVVKPRLKSSWGDVVGEKVRTLSNPVKSIMTRNVMTVQASENIVDAVAKMRQHGFSCLVVTERHRVVGIFTLMDALEPVVAQLRETERNIVVEVSYKMERVAVEDKERVMEVADRFVKRFRKTLGNGVLSLYFKEHREKHGDMRLVHCRARLNSDRFQFVGVGEAWRADLAARTALKVIERQLLVRKELAARYPYGSEFLESLPTSY